jgi:putative zinc finger/helix-turn-helix YgiT family protein
MRSEIEISQAPRCPTCGRGHMWPETITEQFDYEADGERVKVTAEGVPVRTCDNPECRERLSGPEAARIRHEAICRALGLLTPSEIQAIRERLGPSREKFARLTGIGTATLSRWERGRLLQNRAMDNLLRLVARSDDNVHFLQERRGNGPVGGTTPPEGGGNGMRAQLEELLQEFELKCRHSRAFRFWPSAGVN